jgi:hypothetical protein
MSAAYNHALPPTTTDLRCGQLAADDQPPARRGDTTIDVKTESKAMTMTLLHRRALLLEAGGSALLTTGCMTKPLRPANVDGTYCFRTGKSYRPKLTCTPTPIPPEVTEADAKRFEPLPGKLTVYLVRKRWGDAANVVRVSSDGVPWPM